GIDAVLIVEINDVDAEPFEALLAGDRDVIRTPVGEPTLAAGPHVAELGGDDRPVAPVVNGACNQLFALSVAIDIGCIEEVDAKLDGRMDRADALLVVGSAIIACKAGAPHADRGDLQPLSAQFS